MKEEDKSKMVGIGIKDKMKLLAMMKKDPKEFKKNFMGMISEKAGYEDIKKMIEALEHSKELLNFNSVLFLVCRKLWKEAQKNGVDKVRISFKGKSSVITPDEFKGKDYEWRVSNEHLFPVD